MKFQQNTVLMYAVLSIQIVVICMNAIQLKILF